MSDKQIGMNYEKRKTLSSLLWMIFALIVLFMFVDPLTNFLERATKIKIADLVEVESKLENATKKLPQELSKGLDTRLPNSLLKRFSLILENKQDIKVLIAHDKRKTANKIRSSLDELGFSSDIGICPEEVKSLLSRHSYDVVISDVKWSKCDSVSLPNNGIEFLEYAFNSNINQPTVFFISNYDPSLGAPAYAVGITNDWYEVLHLIFDILERKID